MTVADNITRYRKGAGYTMRGLAEEMESRGFPMSHSVISQMENGARRIDVDDLSRLAYVLGCSVVSLLTPHNDDPEAKIGTSASEDDTALDAVARLYSPPSLRYPDWVEDSIHTATGAKWKYLQEGIDLVRKIPPGLADTVEMATTIASGVALSEQRAASDGDD